MPNRECTKQDFQVILDGEVQKGTTFQPGKPGHLAPNQNFKLVQCTGMKDAKDHPVFCHDVLELILTAELMDPAQSTFPRSNLGIWLAEHAPEAKAVYLVLEEPRYLGVDFSLYVYEANGLRRRESGKAERISSGSGCMFPLYLIEKGATVITDTDADPHILKPGALETASTFLKGLQAPDTEE